MHRMARIHTYSPDWKRVISIMTIIIIILAVGKQGAP